MDWTANDPRLRILSLDDEPGIREILGTLFEAWDCAPIFTSQGGETKEFLTRLATQRASIDLVITDVQHPGDDGVEIVRWIRTLDDNYQIAGGLRLRHIPIVVHSAALSEENVRAIRAIDPEIELVMKPSEAEQIRRAIETAVRRYHDAVLSEVETLGVGIIFEGGVFRSFPVCQPRSDRRVECHHFAGTSATAALVPERVLLSPTDGNGQTIAELEQLLNSPRV